MKKETFGKIVGSMEQAKAHAEEKLELRTTKLPVPPKERTANQIRTLRIRRNMSQAVFAAILNVSTSTVQSWEQNKKKPSGPALKLIDMVDKTPEALLEQ